MSCKNYRRRAAACRRLPPSLREASANVQRLQELPPSLRDITCSLLPCRGTCSVSLEKRAKRRRKEVYESFRTAIVSCGGSLTTFNKGILPVVKPQVLLIGMVAGFTACGTSILLRKFGFPKICPIKYGIIENCPVQPS